MTATLSEQDRADVLAIVANGERVHCDWVAHPGSPAHAQRWIQWASDNRYVWPRIFATIRADRAKIAELEATIERAKQASEAGPGYYYELQARVESLEQQLAERTRERNQWQAECEKEQAEAIRESDRADRIESALAAAVRWAEAADALLEHIDRPTINGSPRHCHAIEGIWDNDNGELAGKSCEECARWNRWRAMRYPAIDAAMRGEEKPNANLPRVSTGRRY